MRSPSCEDGILKLLLPSALQYLDEFVQSELLSRRLAYLCCRKIAHMCSNVEPMNNPQSPSVMNSSKCEITNGKEVPVANAVNPLTTAFNDYLTCPHHKDMLYSLSTIIQVNDYNYTIVTFNSN